MHYVGISTYQFIPYYASAIHKHTHTRILKLFEDSEPTRLKVDVARTRAEMHVRKHPFSKIVIINYLCCCLFDFF